MSKPVKQMIINELRDRYAACDGACVVDLAGMTVKEQEGLRAAMRDKSARLEVIRNSLARKALVDTPLQPLGDAFEGPCALVTTKESLIDVAKALVEAAKAYANLKLKEAIVDGEETIISVVQLSKMKGRLELLGEIAMLVASPGRALAGCLGSPQGKIAGCLKTIADRE